MKIATVAASAAPFVVFAALAGALGTLPFAAVPARAADSLTTSSPARALEASTFAAPMDAAGIHPRANWQAWIAGGPYAPPKDPEHWTSPRGRGIALVGCAAPVSAVALLGGEILAWNAQYDAPGATSSGAHLDGRYLGVGPVVKLSGPRAWLTPWVSATPILIYGHVDWSGSTAGASVASADKSSWTGGIAISGGGDVRLRDGWSLGARYEYLPAQEDFDALSFGTADIGVNTYLITLSTRFAR